MPANSQLSLALPGVVLSLLTQGGCSAHRTFADRSPVAPAPIVETIEDQWPDGTLRLRRQVLRKPDGTLTKHGDYTRWYKNGQKEYEATFAQGRVHEVEMQWHDNGQKRTEQHYIHGKRNGPRHDWDPKGRKVKEEHYLDDKPHGTWTVWDKRGRVKWRATFDHGTIVP